MNAYGRFIGQPGARVFVHGDTPLAVGDTVRVTGYGYGARVEDCGRTGVVVQVNRTRAMVDLGLGHSNPPRAIGGTCLAKIEQP